MGKIPKERSINEDHHRSNGSSSDRELQYDLSHPNNKQIWLLYQRNRPRPAFWGGREIGKWGWASMHYQDGTVVYYPANRVEYIVVRPGKDPKLKIEEEQSI